MARKTLAVVAAALLLVASVGPAAAAAGSTLSIDVTQHDDGDATVTVTHNDTAVENASVTVDAPNATYDGEGNHTTDENGTVGLPAPTENVTVEVTATAGNRTGNTTAELVAIDEETDGNESFGVRVSEFVHQALANRGDFPGIGRMVSQWVLDNNPGNAPDHAGPPDNAGPPGDERGPPPVAAVGGTDGNSTATGPRGVGNGGGPPADPGSNGKAQGR